VGQEKHEKGLTADTDFIEEKKEEDAVPNIKSEENLENLNVRKLWIPLINNETDIDFTKGSELDSEFNTNHTISILKRKSLKNEEAFRRKSRKSFSFKENLMELNPFKRKSTKKPSSVQNIINFLTKKRTSQVIPEMTSGSCKKLTFKRI
jgi:hypothetical protein